MGRSSFRDVTTLTVFVLRLSTLPCTTSLPVRHSTPIFPFSFSVGGTERRVETGARGKRGGGFARPGPRAITFSFSACTVLEFMPDGELMRDRFVVITRRRRRRDGKSRKTSGLASLSPRERAAASETEKQGTKDGEGRR